MSTPPFHSHERRTLPRRLPRLVAAAAACVLAGDAFPNPGLAATPASDSTAPRAIPVALPLGATAAPRSGFRAVAAAPTGITFTNRLDEERSLTNQILLNGSGVAAGDVDGDGRPDLYFCGLDAPNALYRNLGNWRFSDITDAAGVACPGQASTGAAFADLDGDGDLDLLVNGIGTGTRLFLNDGRGRFREATAESGLASGSGAASLAIADVDGDGRLDVYVVNYRSVTMRDQPGIAFTLGVTNGVRRLLSVNGRAADTPDLVGRFTFDAAGGVLENGEPDALFHNLGNGRFERRPWNSDTFLDEAGKPVPTPYDWGLSAMFHDLDGDGAPDLYVCNDFQSPDRIWLNDGHGRFRAIPRPAFRQTSLFSMGVDVADLDRDGFMDVFVADMLSRDHRRRHVQVMNATAFLQSRNPFEDRPQFSRNTLFRGRGDGTFAEVAQLAGLAASDWTWCPVFLDVDLDGFEDLLVTTGHWRDAQDADAAREIDAAIERQRLPPREQLRQRRRFPRLATPNYAFRNHGDLTFTEQGAAWGFDSPRISQGIALADLDGDADLDVIVNCLNDGPWLGENLATAARVAVRLRGAPPNTHGIGATVTVHAPGLPPQSQEIACGGRYLSSDEPLRAFAAGHPTNRVRIEVHWRSGRTNALPDVAANSIYEIDEPASPAPAPGIAAPAPASAAPFFEDRSRVLGHQPIDLPYDDFARQPLLPHTLAYPGPAVAWFDFNQDGWEDLFVGAGRGGRVAVFRSDGAGGFIPQRAQILQTPADRDLTGLLGWQAGPNRSSLLLGLDAYETAPSTNAPGLRELSLTSGALTESTLGNTSSTGPLALGDLEGDGELELFVGGRVIPGRYPEAASSSLLRYRAGRLQPDAAARDALAGLGLVQAATFADLHGDHRPELVVACEWGPLRILSPDPAHPGRFNSWNPEVRSASPTASSAPRRLADWTGWWNSVATGDFDGDGRLDLVAGNWGRNTARQAFLGHPIHLRFTEIEGTGSLGLLESHFDPDLGQEVPVRDRNALGAVFPAWLQAFPTFAQFARTTVSDLVAAGPGPFQTVEAVTLDSAVFLNRGDWLELHPLPREAQIAPVFGIAVADFDGDGAQDLVLAQNFHGTSPDESRHDAGLGTWLRGDGHGEFSAVPTARSGLRIPGEGRAAAVCDFDHDGRPDLVVSQNRGPTLLFRNTLGEPGLRITLRGPPGNPRGVGSIVRLEFADGRLGPAQAVQAGSGYWSQDSPSRVLATPTPARAVVVRWPDGANRRVPVAEGDAEMEIGIGN